MRAKILDRVKISVNVEERDLGAVIELDGRAPARRDRIGASYGYYLVLPFRLSFVFPVLSHEYLSFAYSLANSQMLMKN